VEADKLKTMNSANEDQLTRTLLLVCRVLEKTELRYALAGGLAVTVWGEPRATFDVDVALSANPTELQVLRDALRADAHFPVQPDQLAFGRIRVLRAHYFDTLDDRHEFILVDFLSFDADFAASVADRRIFVPLHDRDLPVCSPEDLIVTKLLAGRPKDLEDIRGILRVQRESIDPSHIGRWADRFGLADRWNAIQSAESAG